jgi:hypothetical protein
MDKFLKDGSGNDILLNGERVVAGEEDQAVLNQLSPKARRAAGFLMNFIPAVRLEVLGAFNVDGSLKYPWAAPS